MLAVVVISFSARRWPSDTKAASSAPPARIASLTLATDEVLSRLVPAERIVCVTYLVDDAGISNVANFYPSQIPRLRDVDLERLMTIKPDLVCVAPYNSVDFLTLIERAGVTLYRNEAINSFEEIEAGIIVLGRHIGESERATVIVDEMRSRRAKLADRLRDVTHRPRVLFWSAGFTAGTGTTIDEIIVDAGATNAAAEIGMKGSVEISPERVIATDPDFLLLATWKADERDADINHHPLLRNLRAVTEKRIISLDARYLLCVSQFVLEGAERLAKALHPERFEDAPETIDGQMRPGSAP